MQYLEIIEFVLPELIDKVLIEMIQDIRGCGRIHNMHFRIRIRRLASNRDNKRCHLYISI